MRTPCLLLACAVFSLAAGCAPTPHPVSLQDSFGGDIAAALNDNANGLSTPYVQGSRFKITVQSADGSTRDTWKLSSSNPAVMQIGNQGANTSDFGVVATGSGHATLSVTDGTGKVFDSEDIDVEVPTAMQLCDQGMLMTGKSDGQAAVTFFQMVSGGTATFLVRYFNGTQELAGNNALAVTGSALVSAATVSTSFSVRDFLQVTAGAASGVTDVGLAVGGTTSKVSLVVLDPSSVQSIALAPQDDSKARDGDYLYVMGRALDDNGKDVFGATFTWTANGAAVSTPVYDNGEPTDMLRYQYKGAAAETITDSLSGFTANIQVHGAPATTSTASSEDVGCSVAHGAGAGGGSLSTGILVGLALLASRRRAVPRV